MHDFHYLQYSPNRKKKYEVLEDKQLHGKHNLYAIFYMSNLSASRVAKSHLKYKYNIFSKKRIIEDIINKQFFATLLLM
jgi:hypothetical protein